MSPIPIITPSTEASNGVPLSSADNNGTHEQTTNDTLTNGTTTNGHSSHHQAPVLVPTASLHGKVALVIGASRGIGRGCALELARRGASVVVNYGNSDAAAGEVVDEINNVIGPVSGAKAISVKADVSSVKEIERLFEEAVKWKGRVDICFSNSGTECWDKTEDVTEEKYDRIFALNTKAQFFVSQAFYRHYTPILSTSPEQRDDKPPSGGRLILMSSIAAGLLGVREHALYNASKLAVRGFVTSFATDFGIKGITVNAVAPGGVKSDMFAENAWRYIPGGEAGWGKEKIEALMASHNPLRRCAGPEDVGRVVAFLAGADGGWVNGQTITLSGGSGQ